MRTSSLRFVIVLAACALCACATSHVMIGRARAPISPDMVQIYFHPPAAKYEEIALLDTSSRGGFAITAQGKTDVVIKRLKEEAAKLGANGILLQGVGDESAGSIGTGFGQASASGNTAYGAGFGFEGNVTIKAGNGIAIYVEPAAGDRR
ncbi:MAG TPA: hypothetical protein VMV25_02335 [Steroidobacteraceae bacterium]|nr:hypothetical protein [Steroidobacteraceae bacterium]